MSYCKSLQFFAIAEKSDLSRLQIESMLWKFSNELEKFRKLQKLKYFQKLKILENIQKKSKIQRSEILKDLENKK